MLKFLQNRSLVTSKEIAVIEPSPYFIPRIEQFEMVKEMSKPQDRFHTYKTRSCANIRERIQIESPSYDEELFGTEALMVSKMATDIDEYYQSEFYSERSHMTYCFKPQTEIKKLRETLRKKMDIYWMREQIVKGEIEAQRNEKIVEWTKVQMDAYENLLTSQKEKIFRSTNRVMQEVKGYYTATGVFQKQLNLLQMQIEPLKMSIFNLGNDYIRLAIIQNFQYLVKPLEWRESHDFIHKTSNNELESYEESIERRDKVNIWDRTNVGVFTIKNFIEEFFSIKKHQPEPVFDHGKTLLEAFIDLREKSNLALLQYQLFAQTMADSQKEFIAIEERNAANFKKFTILLNNLGRQKLFLENRSENIQHLAMKLIDRPLEDSVSAEKLRTTKGLIDLIFKKVLSTHANEDNSSSYLTHFEKVSQLELKVFDVLDKLDQVPRDILNQAEAEARTQRQLKWRDANKAYRIETELKQRVDQFQRCLEKPKKKESREGKLPMSVMPKKPKKEDPRFSILTPLEKDYIRAFTAFGVRGEVKFDKEAKKMIDRIKNESVPFYVDHLLDSIGFKIKKDSRKSIDNIMDEEEKYFKYKELLPIVRNEAQLQALQRERIKKENIRKTSYLYEP